MPLSVIRPLSVLTSCMPSSHREQARGNGRRVEMSPKDISDLVLVEELNPDKTKFRKGLKLSDLVYVEELNSGKNMINLIWFLLRI